MAAIGKYTLELRCDHLWHVGDRVPYVVIGEYGVECRAYARQAGWVVGRTQIICPVCVKKHAERVQQRKLERSKRKKQMTNCPKCNGATGYTYQYKGRTRSHRWGVPAPDSKIKCRDCERGITFCASTLCGTAPNMQGKPVADLLPTSASSLMFSTPSARLAPE